MTGIVKQVQHVTDLINEISAATKEQTSGIARINDAVLQLSDVTQQNAALVEQRSEEHTSELQSLMRISYAVFCLNKKKKQKHKSTQMIQTTSKKKYRKC